MAIKVKAIERKLKFVAGEDGKFEYRYVLQADLYNKLTQAKVIQEASLRSGISKGAINAAWDAIGEVVKAWATEGHSVAIPGLGSMRFGLRSKSVINVNDVASSLITSRRVIFVPSTDIKDELKATSVSITCIDRDGNIVKRVTSNDDSEIEDNEDDNNDPNGGGSTPSGGGTQGSGTDSGNTSRQYTISVTSANTAQGTVSGGGTYSEGSRVNISATPKAGYQFDKWNDGNTSATRTVSVSKNESFVAQFKVADSTEPGGSGDDDTPEYI